MKYCSSCVLPETFPGIEFDVNGECQYCKMSNSKTPEQKQWNRDRLFKKFMSVLKQYTKSGKNGYDGILGYSGGKDSTFTMKVLKEDFGLNLLAVTFDNGFLGEDTKGNILKMVDEIGVDHVFFRPDINLLKRVYRICAEKDIYAPKTLERASTICTTCMAFVKSAILRTALERKIPFVFYGWSPGQAPLAGSFFRFNSSLILNMELTVVQPLEKATGSEIRRFFPDPHMYDKDIDFPYNVNLLALIDYKESEIFEVLTSLGWKKPQGTDTNSSNCLLNSFAINIHRNRLGFHPYAFELAGLVREGFLQRHEALERLDAEEPAETVKYIRNELGF